LNLSEKLYKNSYRILEKDKICFLSENWEKDYQKHNDYEYKRYIFDRFDNFDVDHKRKV
jgi:hypothetical protein